jgi:2-oxoisovalerate dehydrogenase E2 component (dihydrolipoyl transacylase)
MATYNFALPDIGEGIVEAEIVAWYVSVGDVIEEDAPLADLMTDKATVEMTAPVGGRIVALAGEVGDQVAIGSMLARFEVEAEDAAVDVPAALTAPEPAPGGPAEVEVFQPTVQSVAAKPAPPPAAKPEEPVGDGATVPLAEKGADGRRVHASPAVRQRARALAIDLAEVKPTAEGRIRHADLDAYLSYNAGRGFAAAGQARADEQVKVVGLRRRIAENMAASKRSIPHFSYIEEVDVTKLEGLRADLNASRGERPRLTILPLLIVAVAKALPAFPMINARYDDDAGVVTRYGSLHLGIATQTDAGLMVPVIRDAHTLNLWQLAGEIVRLSEAARSGKAEIRELSGSTLTITSLGPLGGIATTPVINRPEVAIIGPNKIVERPVWRGDKVERALLMNLSISCDHRVVDGWDAARFVQELRRRLETPALLLID